MKEKKELGEKRKSVYSEFKTDTKYVITCLAISDIVLKIVGRKILHYNFLLLLVIALISHAKFLVRKNLLSYSLDISRI